MRCFGPKALDSLIIIRNCECLSRVINCLKYYQSLQKNIDDERTRNFALEMYLNEEYKDLLNDYHHVISTHSEHLEQIHSKLQDCSMSNCSMAQRRINRFTGYEMDDDYKDGSEISNSKMTFYLEIIHSIHFWLYHQFDVG